MIFLSIIIPTYNRCRTLLRSIQSALATDSQEIEVLVSDNTSPDNTPQVLAEVSDPRCRHWRNAENIGAERNISKLLHEAKGRWVLVLTDDDYLLPGAVDYLISTLKENPDVGVVLSDLEQCDEAGKTIDKYSFCPKTGVLAAGLPSIRFFFQGSHVISRIVYRRELMDLKGVENHWDSMYPQMYLTGAILRKHPGLYLEKPIICHTVGNETFWSHRPDYSLGRRVKMIRELFPDPKYRKIRKFLLSQLFDLTAAHLGGKFWRERQWLKFQLTLLRSREIRSSSAYWSSVFNFLQQRLREARTK